MPKKTKANDRQAVCVVRGMFIHPCAALVEICGTERRGVRMDTIFDIPSCKPIGNITTAYLGDHRKRGIVLNFCPFCGVDIAAHFTERQKAEVS